MKNNELAKAGHVVQPHGGSLLRGGLKGNRGGGRPRDDWKRELQRLASGEETLAHLEAVLSEGPSHPFFFRALDYCTEHGYGKAPVSVDLGAPRVVIGKAIIGINIDDI